MVKNLNKNTEECRLQNIEHLMKNNIFRRGLHIYFKKN